MGDDERLRAIDRLHADSHRAYHQQQAVLAGTRVRVPPAWWSECGDALRCGRLAEARRQVDEVLRALAPASPDLGRHSEQS